MAGLVGPGLNAGVLRCTVLNPAAHVCLRLCAGTDDWSIHKGSCGYGALWQDEPHG